MHCVHISINYFNDAYSNLYNIPWLQKVLHNFMLISVCSLFLLTMIIVNAGSC